MSSKVKKLSSSMVELVLTAESTVLEATKLQILKGFQKEVSSSGFRKGKVPINLVEKQVDSQLFQREFIDECLNQLFKEAIAEHDLRMLGQPEVKITKFVPYGQLEATITVAVVPPISLPHYKSMKKTKPTAEVEANEVSEVVASIRTRLASKKPVERPAQVDDEVVIDFVGVDSKGAKINGGSGKDYPLRLGSKSFIPGFEEAIVGLKTGEDKTFDVAFPKNYGAKLLAGSKAKFTVTVSKVLEVALPEVDDVFAAKAGPFKTVKELKEDIRKQLAKEKLKQAETKLTNEILEELAEKTKLDLPETLVAEQLEALRADLQKNLTYRSLTMAEFLAQQGLNEADYEEKQLLPSARMRVKLGLMLSEIAKVEAIAVTPEEFEVQLQVLKGQYNDEQMQQQLDNPEARRELMSQMLSSKTVDFLYRTIVN